MTARVLVVDDVPANLKLLEVRLTAEYFEVVTACNGAEALRIADKGDCDIVLLDVMMPGMDGIETCRILKANPATHHIPVVIVTALDQPEDRVRGLEAGAEDFLTKPVSDVALITRVRSLSRLKTMMDELRLRVTSGLHMGIDEALAATVKVDGNSGRLLLVDDRPDSSDRVCSILSPRHGIDVEVNPQEAILRVADVEYDAVLISLALTDFDALRLCSQMRSIQRTRNLPLLILAEQNDSARVLRALEIGANDYVVRPVERNELIARVATQVKRKRYADTLRDNLQVSVAMALVDQLTGLHNRRYMETHLQMLVAKSSCRGRDLSVMMLDIDYFKSVNDTFGHDVGDEVLKEFATRLRRAVRGIDLACRYGGEEFVIVMPESGLPISLKVAERIRQAIAGELFIVDNGARAIEVTVSIGVASLDYDSDTADSVLKRADHALYAAKREGRNRVTADAA